MYRSQTGAPLLQKLEYISLCSQYRATELGLGTLGLGLTTGGAAAAVVMISRPQQPHNTSPARTVRWCCSCCSSMCWVHSTLMPLQIYGIFSTVQIYSYIFSFLLKFEFVSSAKYSKFSFSGRNAKVSTPDLCSLHADQL